MKKNIKIRISFYLLVIITLSSGDMLAQPQGDLDAFASLNMDFRKTYKLLRSEVIDKQNPTILLIGDDIILIKKERRDTQKMLVPIYHDLKTIAHIPFAIYLTLVNVTDLNISEVKRLQLNHFRKLMKDVHEELPNRDFTNEQIQTQELIFKMSFEFIDQVLSKGFVKSEMLSQFILSNRPYFELNIREAVKSQIDRMHDIVNKWYFNFSEEEKYTLKVLVSGPQIARENTLAVQYFSKYLREKGEGSRIFYTEGVYREDGMMNVMGNYILSVKSGNDMFNNPKRLLEDLLGQAAEKYLQEMKF